MEEAPKKTKEELMAEADNIARNYFRQGLNCSECVLRTFLDMHDSPLPDEVMALASGFGGGVGRTRNMCGAISGAVMALGVVNGRKNPFEKETPRERAKELTQVYKPFAEMINEVQDTYGTVICRELSAPHGDFECKERKKSCQQIIGHCAALATKYAMEQEEKTTDVEK